MRSKTTADDVEDLRRALTVSCQWRSQPSVELRYGQQLIRDNAIRLIETLKLAEPFLRSPPRRVLECGAGPLYTVNALGWRYGDELDLYTIEHPEAISDELPLELDRRGVKFAAHDLLADSAPFPGVKFNLIVLAEVIEHIPPTELPQMIRRLAGSLGDDGALLVSSPNSQAISNVLSLALGNGQMLDVAFPPESGSYGHIRMYSKNEVEELLEYAGLRVHDWKLSNWMHAHPRPNAPLRDRIRLGIQRTMPTVVPRWASGWICSATRASHARSEDRST